GGDGGGKRGRLRAVKGDGGVRGRDAAESKLRTGELGPGREWRRYRVGGHIDRGQRLVGGLELADEELTTCPDQAGVKRIGVVAERHEPLRGSGERMSRPGEIARGGRE